MTERVRITRARAAKARSGKDVVELFSHDTRLEYPALYLFDFSLLPNVGIQPDELTADPVHCNFWGLYVLSNKLNTHGNPYKNVIALEPIDAPATSTSTDTSAIVAELRAIKALLLQMVTEQAPGLATPDTTTDPDQTRAAMANLMASPRAARLAALTRVPTHGTINGPTDPQATDPQSVESVPCAEAAQDSAPESVLSEPEARTAFYALAGPAIAEGNINAAEVNDLVKDANGGGWPAALAALKKKLQ